MTVIVSSCPRSVTSDLAYGTRRDTRVTRKGVWHLTRIARTKCHGNVNEVPPTFDTFTPKLLVPVLPRRARLAARLTTGCLRDRLADHLAVNRDAASNDRLLLAFAPLIAVERDYWYNARFAGQRKTPLMNEILDLSPRSCDLANDRHDRDVAVFYHRDRLALHPLHRWTSLVPTRTQVTPFVVTCQLPPAYRWSRRRAFHRAVTALAATAGTLSSPYCTPTIDRPRSNRRVIPSTRSIFAFGPGGSLTYRGMTRHYNTALLREVMSKGIDG